MRLTAYIELSSTSRPIKPLSNRRRAPVARGRSLLRETAPRRDRAAVRRGAHVGAEGAQLRRRGAAAVQGADYALFFDTC